MLSADDKTIENAHKYDCFDEIEVFALAETRSQRFRTSLAIGVGECIEPDMPCWPDEHLQFKVKYLGEEMHLVLMEEGSASKNSKKTDFVFAETFI